MSIFKELKRRNVFRVAAAYVITSWLFVQGLELAADAFEAPAWVMKMIIAFIVLGFMPTLLFSWAYELTPDGIKREKDISPSTSITDHTGRKLDFVTLAAALGVAGMFVFQQFVAKPQGAYVDSETAAQQSADTGVDDDVVQSRPIDRDGKSIAVLPFANMANDSENEPFTVGIHDDLLTNLSKISALKVISRTSVLRYKDTRLPIRQIAEELGVSTILEGGVQRAGDQIRINVQLIDAATDEHLWAEKYDRQLTAANIFKIQSEISGHIAQALKAQLTPEEAANLDKKPTDNLDAYNAYLAGRQRMLKRSSEQLEIARDLFSRAIELDPEFALAYVGKADSINLLNEYGDLPYERKLSEGMPLVNKALQLNPQLAEAHATLANYQMAAGDNAKAEENFKKALAINPNYATSYHWYGLLLRNEGRSEEALTLHRKAAALDPYSPVIQANVGWSLQANGQYGAAMAQFLRTIELDPEYPGALAAISGYNLLEGKLEQAIIWKRKVIALDPGNVGQRIGLAFAYMDIGDFQAASKELSIAGEIAPNHEYLEFGRFLLDIKDGNYDRAHERVTGSGILAGGRSLHQFALAISSMVQGDHETAIQQMRALSSATGPDTFNLGSHSLSFVDDLIWSLQQSGQTSEADDLRARALTLLDNTPKPEWRDTPWVHANLLALGGNEKAAAQAFADAIDAGYRTGWWLEQKSPWMVKVKEQPAYTKAWERLQDDLALQRNRLAEHDAKLN